jgi:hypothetical protein
MTNKLTLNDLSLVETHILRAMPDDWCDWSIAIRGYTADSYGLLIHFNNLIQQKLVEQRIGIDGRAEYRRTDAGRALCEPG